jgi:hypothetical protein
LILEEFMDRRFFVNSLVTGSLTAVAAPSLFPGDSAETHAIEVASPVPWSGEPLFLSWKRKEGQPLFEQVICQDVPLVGRGGHGLMTAEVAVETSSDQKQIGLKNRQVQIGFCSATLEHKLFKWGATSWENVLEARLTLRNHADQPCGLTARFNSSARPYSWGGEDRVHLPLSASVLEKWNSVQGLENNPYQECDQFAGHPSENNASILCHYLEPEESDVGVRDTRGPLLIPCIDLYHPEVAWRLAFFAESERPWRIASFGTPQGECGWSLGTRVKLTPREETTLCCYLLIHSGKVETAWQAFHELAHHEDFPSIAWPRDVLVHYYDFLGPGNKP